MDGESMIKNEILHELNRDEKLRIREKLSMDKILNGMRGREFYKEMSEPFLKDVLQMTGTENGIVRIQGIIRFIITVPCYDDNPQIESFAVNFNKFDSRFMSISDIIYSGRPAEEEAIPETLNSRLIRQIIIPQLTRFRVQARQQGYLISNK